MVMVAERCLIRPPSLRLDGLFRRLGGDETIAPVSDEVSSTLKIWIFGDRITRKMDAFPLIVVC